MRTTLSFGGAHDLNSHNLAIIRPGSTVGAMATNLMTELVARREVLLAATGLGVSTMWLLSRRSETIVSASEMVLLPTQVIVAKQVPEQVTADTEDGATLKRRPSWSAKFEGHQGTVPEATKASVGTLQALACNLPTQVITTEQKAEQVTANTQDGTKLRRRLSWSAKFEGHEGTVPEGARKACSMRAQLDLADEAAGKRLQRRPSWSAKFEGHEGTLPEATQDAVAVAISNATKVPRGSVPSSHALIPPPPCNASA